MRPPLPLASLRAEITKKRAGGESQIPILQLKPAAWGQMETLHQTRHLPPQILEPGLLMAGLGDPSMVGQD